MRLFIDANILFTAAYSPNGRAWLLLDSGLDLISSAYAVEEARKNIQRKKPSAQTNLDHIVNKFRIVPTVYGTCPIELPEKDKPIFLSALAARATHLITGDLKDFGPHMNQSHVTCGVVIQSVADFLSSL